MSALKAIKSYLRSHMIKRILHSWSFQMKFIKHKGERPFCMGDCLWKRLNKFLFQKHFFISESNSLNMPSLTPIMFSSRKKVPFKIFGVKT